MKKILIYAGILLSILFLWLALKDVSFALVSEAFANANLVMIIPLIMCNAGFYWLKAARWSTILSPKHFLSSSKLMPSMMAGAAGNNLLPAHAGELIRVYFAGTQFKIYKATVLASLVVERLMDMFAVLLIFSAAILVGGYSKAMIAAGSAMLVIVIVLTVACALIVIYADQCVDFFRNRLTVPSSIIRFKIANQIANVAEGFASLRETNLYLNIICNSIAQWLLMAASVYFSFLALNIEASFSLAVVIVGLIVVGLTLPTVPGFFGTIEYCFVLGLTAAGVEPSLAISAGIFYHIPQWLGVTLVGLVLAHTNSLSFSKAKADQSL